MRVLLDAPWKYKLSTENIELLVKVVTTILKQEYAQRQLLEVKITRTYNVHYLMTFYLNTYSREIQNALTTDSKDVSNAGQLTGDVMTMTASRIELVRIFAILARVDFDWDFCEGLDKMVEWVQAKEPQIRICANVFIGNLIYGRPGRIHELVHDPYFCRNLAQSLGLCDENEVLTSALDLLNNLAADKVSRTYLTETSIIYALVKCSSNPAVNLLSRHRTFYHMRQILRGCLPLVYKFLEVTNPNPNVVELHEIPLDAVMTLFHKTQDATLRVEIGRTVAEIWRTIHGSVIARKIQAHARDHIKDLRAAQDPMDPLDYRLPARRMALAVRDGLMRHPKLTDPILVLIQHTNPSLKTEGWLIMAFMSLWKEGAQAVYDTLCTNGMLEMVRKVVQAPDLESKDRANARYTIVQLQEQFVSTRTW